MPGKRPEGTARRSSWWGRMPRWLQWGLRGGFTIGVTWIIADQLGVTVSDALALERAAPDPNSLRIGASLLLLFTGFMYATRLWGWMVRDLEEPDPGLLASASVILTANLGRYVPGKVWQIAGLALLSRRHGVTATTGTLAGLLIQAFSLAAAAIWALPALIEIWGGNPGASTPWLIAGAVMLLLLVAGMLPGLVHGVFQFVFRLARRDPAEAPRTGRMFVPRWLAAHGVLWGMYGVAFFLLLDGLGLSIPVGQAVVSFAAAYLLGYLALPAPAGIGVREGVLTGLLMPELGVAAAPAAIVARLWMTGVELIPAGALAIRESVRSPGPPPSPGSNDEQGRGS